MAWWPSAFSLFRACGAGRGAMVAGKLFSNKRLGLLWLMVFFGVGGPQLANQLGLVRGLRWGDSRGLCMGLFAKRPIGFVRRREGRNAVSFLPSLILFAAVYALLCCGVRVSASTTKIRHGPDDADLEPHGKTGAGRPRRNT